MRILITGASGQLGPYIVGRLLRERHDVAAWTHRSRESIAGIVPQSVAMTDREAIARAFDAAAPDAVVHCAAISNIHEAFVDPRRAAAVNVEATARLSQLAQERGAHLSYLSTDLVFDGERGNYAESDEPRPLSVYAQTKLAGEAPVRDAGGLVLRIPLVFGPSLNGRMKFFDQLVASLRAGEAVTLFDDEWRTPVTPPLVAAAIETAIRERVTGLHHFAGPDRLSRHEMGVRLARVINADESLCLAASRLSVASAEPCPRDTSLDAAKWFERFPSFPRPSFDAALTAEAPSR